MIALMLEGVRVVLADDAALWRDGVARILCDAGAAVVAQVGDAPSLTEAVDRERPDIAIVDVRMPPTLTDDGLRAAGWIRRNVPGVGVLVLCQHVHSGAPVELLNLGEGGVGYLLKERVSDAGELLDAVALVAAGGSAIDPEVSRQLLARRGEGDLLSDLSDRELEVLALMAQGASNQAIAETLFIVPKTVDAHAGKILMKLGIPDDATTNRRVVAVLRYLSAAADGPPVG